MEKNKSCKWCGGGIRKAGKRYNKVGTTQLYGCAVCHRVSAEYKTNLAIRRHIGLTESDIKVGGGS